MHPESGFPIALNWPKLGKVIGTSQFTNMTLLPIFLCCCIFVVKFNYCSKFHFNIITGSGVIAIFVYKILIKNLEIGIIPVWILPNWGELGGLGWVRDTRFGTECYWMLQKCQGKPTGGKINPSHPPTHIHTPRLGLKQLESSLLFLRFSNKSSALV